MTPEGRSLSFGQCEVNGVSFRELRDHFGTIKENVVSTILSWYFADVIFRLYFFNPNQ